jgi:hypothetical protein
VTVRNGVFIDRQIKYFDLDVYILDNKGRMGKAKGSKPLALIL